MKFADQVVIITGGSAGIGLAAARLFAREGASVVIAARNSERGRKATEIVRSEGRSCLFVAADVARNEDARRIVESALEQFGRLDVLVNNAGAYGLRGTVVEMSVPDWDTIVDVNLKGTFLCSKYAIPAMLQQERGSIVNVSSGAGLIGRPRAAAYCAAKAAVINLTRQMALDFAKQNIRVNCVIAGGVDTPGIRQSLSNRPDPEDAIRLFAEMHPVGRLGTPEEIAEAILFLASDAASFITGASLVVDGGVTAGI